MCKVLVSVWYYPAEDQTSADVYSREEQCPSQWAVFPFTLMFPS